MRRLKEEVIIRSPRYGELWRYRDHRGRAHHPQIPDPKCHVHRTHIVRDVAFSSLLSLIEDYVSSFATGPDEIFLGVGGPTARHAVGAPPMMG